MGRDFWGHAFMRGKAKEYMSQAHLCSQALMLLPCVLGKENPPRSKVVLVAGGGVRPPKKERIVPKIGARVGRYGFHSTGPWAPLRMLVVAGPKG